MARAPTTSDAFNAVAEPRRREILEILVRGEQTVTELVSHLRLDQPQVSKHLRVLREVGLVEARVDGRQRLYRLAGSQLKPIHDCAMRKQKQPDYYRCFVTGDETGGMVEPPRKKSARKPR